MALDFLLTFVWNDDDDDDDDNDNNNNNNKEAQGSWK
jgi:hypothetical protein